MSFAPRLLLVEGAEDARAELERLGADPAGVARMAAKMETLLVKVPAVPCRAANILKQEMLSLGADAAVARGSVACSIPATDVILIGTLKQHRLLSERLQAQPFGLRALAGELRELLQALLEPRGSLEGKGVTLPLDRPLIMGILNVTPDSFSDGGLYAGVEEAVARARVMFEEGADIIDLGGESTRPGAPAVDEITELDRVLPVVERLSAELPLPISVDTNKSTVARAVLRSGAAFINDISGLHFDPEMAGVVAEEGAGLFLMHTRGRPDRMQEDTRYGDLMGEIIVSLRASVDMALEAGVPLQRLSVDPGIGFGKDASANLEILRRLPELRSLGCPILLGTSRKNFIGRILGQPDPSRRLHGTMATVAAGVERGAHIFRVHDVAPARETALMAWAIRHHQPVPSGHTS